MNENRICPACGSEYQPHIEICADCNEVLLSSDQYIRAQEERDRAEATYADDSVKVLDGDLDWMSELRSVLLDAGIPCRINDAGCRKGCCGNTVQLMVSPEDLDKARHVIEEYLLDMDPDLRLAKEMFGQGKCPACGSPIAQDARECPDCGLPLIIEG